MIKLPLVTAFYASLVIARALLIIGVLSVVLFTGVCVGIRVWEHIKYPVPDCIYEIGDTVYYHDKPAKVKRVSYVNTLSYFPEYKWKIEYTLHIPCEPDPDFGPLVEVKVVNSWDIQ